MCACDYVAAMERGRDVTEDEMILAFLRAERGSKRWGDIVRTALNGNMDLLRDADLTDSDQNDKRRQALATYRGYGENRWLFGGFPQEVEWAAVRVGLGELGGMCFVISPDTVTPSGERVFVGQVAEDLDTLIDGDLKQNIRDFERAVSEGAQLDTSTPLIAAAEEPESVHVLLEGYTRSVVFVRRLPIEVELELIVGYAPGVLRWSVL